MENTHLGTLKRVPYHHGNEGININCFRCLVLDKNNRPSQFNESTFISWQEAVTFAVSGRVETIRSYEREIHSPSMSIALPAVVRLNHARRFECLPTPAFTIQNLLRRDNYACVYCGCTKTSELTYDHVHPRSKGGAHRSWENAVIACKECNGMKADKLLEKFERSLRYQPYVPTHRELFAAYLTRLYWLHESWKNFFPKSTILRPDAKFLA